MIVVLGEAVVDLVEQPAGLYRAHPGGSPLNVAVGLARLGRPASLQARISADAFGRLLRRHLAESGVGDRLLVAATESSTLAVASIGPDGGASYDFWVEGAADWQWTAAELAQPFGADAVALHTGSMVLEVEPGASLVVELLRRERARGQLTISYDPNVRLARQQPGRARDRVADVVGLAHLVKVSTEDLAWLYPGEDPRDVARRWVGVATAGTADAPAADAHPAREATGATGDRAESAEDVGAPRPRPSLVVVTMGADGAFAVTSRGVQRQRAARPVAVADTVGAGDAFTAGLLDGLAAAGLLGRPARPALSDLDAADLDELLGHAALVAGLTCARPGADPPTRAEVSAAAAATPSG